MNRTKSKSFDAIAIIFLIVFFFYWRIFLLKGAWLNGDHTEQHFPWAYQLWTSLRKLSIPFWTPLISAGFPIVAEGQMGAFYLPNLIFYSLFSIDNGYALKICFHLLVSAFSMYVFLKSLSLTKLGSLFGVCVYMFGSTLGGAFYNITSLQVLCWFPITLWLCDKILERAKFYRAIILGLLFSLQILAGYLQYAAYSMLFTGLYFLIRDFSEKKPFSDRYPAYICFLGACVLALGLAFPQLYLTFRLAISSGRANLSESFAYIGSFSPLGLIASIFPSLESLFGTKLYLGIITIFFTLVGLTAFKDSRHKVIYLLALFALLLSLGQFNPIFILMIKILKFYSFRTPMKFLFFFGFFLSVIASFGFDRFRFIQERQKILGLIRNFIFTSMVGLSLVLVGFFTFSFFQPLLLSIGEHLLKTYYLGKPGHPHDWPVYAEKLTSFIASSRDLLNPCNAIIYLPILKIITAVLILFYLTNHKRKPILLGVSVIGFLIFDLYTYSFADVQRDYVSFEDFHKKDSITRHLELSAPQNTYFIFSSNPSNAPLPVSKNMLYGIPSINMYSPLAPKHLYDFMRKLGGVNDSTGYPIVDSKEFESRMDDIRFLGAHYILTDFNLDHLLGDPTVSQAHWKLYRITDNQPTFALYTGIRIIENVDTRKDLIHSDTSFDPTKEVLVGKKPNFSGHLNSTIRRDVVMIKASSPEKYKIEAITSSDQVLLFRQSFDEGWKAYLDGNPVELLRCTQIFMGIALKQGRHNIEFKYSPLAFLSQRIQRTKRSN